MCSSPRAKEPQPGIRTHFTISLYFYGDMTHSSGRQTLVYPNSLPSHSDPDSHNWAILFFPACGLGMSHFYYDSEVLLSGSSHEFKCLRQVASILISQMHACNCHLHYYSRENTSTPLLVQVGQAISRYVHQGLVSSFEYAHGFNHFTQYNSSFHMSAPLRQKLTSSVARNFRSVVEKGRQNRCKPTHDFTGLNPQTQVPGDLHPSEEQLSMTLPSTLLFGTSGFHTRTIPSSKAVVGCIESQTGHLPSCDLVGIVERSRNERQEIRKVSPKTSVHPRRLLPNAIF